MDKIERKKATRVPVSKSARKVYKYSGKVMDKKSDDSRLLEEGMKKASPRKSSPAQKRLKVKDMPRKQQMAVKASMAEQSAFKMKGFSGFGGIDPTKDVVKFDAKGGFKKVGPKASKLDMTLNDKLNKAVRRSEAKEFLRKNTIKPKAKKPLSRPFGPGTRPLARNVSKGLKTFGRRIGVVGAVAGVKDIFDSYGKMGKTKTGKRIMARS
jgi:hypothetical protein